MTETSQSSSNTVDIVRDGGEGVLTQEIKSSSTGPIAEPLSTTSSDSSVSSSVNDTLNPSTISSSSTRETSSFVPVKQKNETSASYSATTDSNDEIIESVTTTTTAMNNRSPKRDLPQISPEDPKVENSTNRDLNADIINSETNEAPPQSKQDPNHLASSRTATPPSPPQLETPPVNIDYNPQLLMQYQQIMMQQQHFHQMQQLQQQHQKQYPQYNPASFVPMTSNHPHMDYFNADASRTSFVNLGQPPKSPDKPNRSTIQLELVEEVRPKIESIHENPDSDKSFFFRRPRRRRSVSQSSVFSETKNSSTSSQAKEKNAFQLKPRGNLSVSWYEGTSSAELQEHVRESLSRKLCLEPTMGITNLRVLDESVSPHEEIVLSPVIPDGSKFLLRFEIKDISKKDSPKRQASPFDFEASNLADSLIIKAPDSPSAAPSPFPSTVDLQNLQQQIGAFLNAELGNKGPKNRLNTHPSPRPTNKLQLKGSTKTMDVPPLPDIDAKANKLKPKETVGSKDTSVKRMDTIVEPKILRDSEKKELSNSQLKNEGKKKVQDDVIAQRLIELNELLLHNRQESGKVGTQRYYKSEQSRQQEKKQVIFVLANYFVLFISLIAISAELHARAPQWIEWVQTNVTSVQNCAADRDQLFECVSDGDFSGLIASLILWASKSATTKQIFLFGFDTPKKLWTVVYESAVTAICWGTSYIFIRRGLNPDTRPNFLHKFWKDAVYGSLAGFNAAFMKAILKNMVPQDQVLDVFEHRQLKIVHFLGQIFKDKND